MKETSIIFDETQQPDFTELAGQLFGDSDDPRSNSYKRVLIRPTIPWGKIVLAILIPAILIAALLVLSHALKLGGALAAVIICVPLLVYLCLIAKKAAITLVRIYQHFAPDSIRNRCCFEPSCSQYMILAINKYGLLKGVKKGIGRLKRCNVNGGGYEMP